MYLQYSEYAAMGGDRPRCEFDRINFRAQSLITRLTHGRIETENPARDAARYAAFAVVQAMFDDAESGADAKEIASVSNDGVAVSYATTGKAPIARYAAIIREYLGTETDSRGTPLLYAGVP